VATRAQHGARLALHPNSTDMFSQSHRNDVPGHTCRIWAQGRKLDERRIRLAQGGPQLTGRLHVGPLGSACRDKGSHVKCQSRLLWGVMG